MARFLLANVLALLTILLLSAASPFLSAGEKPRVWQTDAGVARELAVKSDRPIVVFVTAKWCGYCRRMQHDTLSNQAVIRRLEDHFVPLLIDADEHPEMIERLKVKRFPSTLVFAPNGKFLDRVTGYLSPSRANAWLDRLATAFRDDHLQSRQALRNR